METQQAGCPLCMKSLVHSPTYVSRAARGEGAQARPPRQGGGREGHRLTSRAGEAATGWAGRVRDTAMKVAGWKGAIWAWYNRMMLPSLEELTLETKALGPWRSLMTDWPNQLGTAQMHQGAAAAAPRLAAAGKTKAKLCQRS